MTRLNIALPEELHRRLRLACALKELTIAQLVERALAAKLREGQPFDEQQSSG